MNDLASRWTGGKAVNLRRQPIPWAYRVFFRQVGIDPDVQRTPIEQVALDRMQHGNFRTGGNVEDALTVGIAETGVALVALDAGALAGPLCLGLAAREESMAGGRRPLSSGQLVLADDEGVLGVLFGDLSPRAEVGRSTRRVLIAAIQVKGVPEVSCSEALWTATVLLVPAPD